MKEIQCPAERAAAVPVPLTRPISSAGQHHAPINAGMLSVIVSTESMSDLRRGTVGEMAWWVESRKGSARVPGVAVDSHAGAPPVGRGGRGPRCQTPPSQSSPSVMLVSSESDLSFLSIPCNPESKSYQVVLFVVLCIGIVITIPSIRNCIY